MKRYKGKKVCILGRHGFIGSAIEKKLKKLGAATTSTPTKDCDFIFAFASPTHLPFEKNPAYHAYTVMASFEYLFRFCLLNDIKLVWPSSALVYEKDTEFARFKKGLEELQTKHFPENLGLRIFPIYGETEGDRGHPTAIYQWCESMKKGESPIVYGDGEQKRDFIHIDDVVDNVLKYAIDGTTGIKDIGSGNLVSFNEIIKHINKELRTEIKPKYVDAPKGYAAGIFSKDPVEIKVGIKRGIKKMVESDCMVNISGFQFETRYNSSDLGIIRSVFRDNVYRMPGYMKEMTVIDIGAQIGSASLLAASRGAIVYAYEPFSESYKLLVENINRNGYGDKIIPFNKAVGTPGKRKLYIHETNTGSNSLDLILPDFDEEHYEEVETVTLKSIMEDNKIDHCDFLKMDCEGGEKEIVPEILNGLHEKIDTIAAEFHINMSKGQTLDYDETEKELMRNLDKIYKRTELSDSEFLWTK